jgi:hypothetical protein
MLQKISPSAGLGALLLANMSRGTLAKAATTVPVFSAASKPTPARPPAFAVADAFAAVQRRDGCLFAPMFSMTKAANSLARETVPSLIGPQPEPKAPGKPGSPAGMTTPAANYRRAPGQPDAIETLYNEQMRQTAAARTALRESIKAVHQSGGSPAAFGSAGPVIL